MIPNPYIQQIMDTARQYGVDPNLALGVARQESGINPNVKDSPTGAIGIMQLEPGTASDLGVNPRDVTQNIVGGIRYLRQMQDQFKDPKLTLAAYNAGPERVRDYLNKGRPLPDETTNYVRSISGAPLVASYQSPTPLSGKTPMANVFQMAQNANQPQQPVLFGGNPTPVGAIGGIARMLGIGSEPELGRHLQNAGAALMSVGNFGQNGMAGAAAMQNAANMPLFRQRFTVVNDAYGNRYRLNIHSGEVTSLNGQPAGGGEQQQPQAVAPVTGPNTPGDGAPGPMAGEAVSPEIQKQQAQFDAIHNTPAGQIAYNKAITDQSLKAKQTLEDNATQAQGLINLLDKQIELSKDPHVIQGSFDEARHAFASAESLLTGHKYGYETAEKSDQFNKNNGQIISLQKSLLGSNPMLRGPEIAFLEGLSPGSDKQMGANIAIYNHLRQAAQRQLYAAQLARQYPLLGPEYYAKLNQYMEKNPIYTDNAPDAGLRTGKGALDPMQFYKGK